METHHGPRRRQPAHHGEIAATAAAPLQPPPCSRPHRVSPTEGRALHHRRPANRTITVPSLTLRTRVANLRREIAMMMNG